MEVRVHRGSQPRKIDRAVLSKVVRRRPKKCYGLRVSGKRQASFHGCGRGLAARNGAGMTRKIVYFSTALVAGFLLIACERATISQINADPSRYVNKEVAVVGRVTKSIGAFTKGIYQVDDGTGVIWVLSLHRGAPSQGVKVGVKGHIKPTITFLGMNYATVMEETDRRTE
jgi:hypothetical protein